MLYENIICETKLVKNTKKVSHKIKNKRDTII